MVTNPPGDSPPGRRIRDRRKDQVGPPAGTPERRELRRRVSDMPKPPCPFCGASTSVVYRSQRRAVVGSDGYQRRRQCGECGRDWPTIEVLDVGRFERELVAHDEQDEAPRASAGIPKARKW